MAGIDVSIASVLGALDESKSVEGCCLFESNTIVHNDFPDSLDSRGVVDSIQSMAEAFEGRGAIPAKFELTIDDREFLILTRGETMLGVLKAKGSRGNDAERAATMLLDHLESAPKRNSKISVTTKALSVKPQAPAATELSLGKGGSDDSPSSEPRNTIKIRPATAARVRAGTGVSPPDDASLPGSLSVNRGGGQGGELSGTMTSDDFGKGAVEILSKIMGQGQAAKLVERTVQSQVGDAATMGDEELQGCVDILLKLIPNRRHRASLTSEFASFISPTD